MKVLAYKCKFTGKLFDLEDKKKYLAHMRKIREGLRKEREEKEQRETFEKWFAEEQQKIVHVDMIAPWVIENQQRLMIAYCAFGKQGWDKIYPRHDVINDLKISVRYDPLTSNSHAKPRDGVFNWCARDKALPVGYPGYSGTIKGCITRKTKSGYFPTTEFLKWVGIYTGTGGGGDGNFQYGVTIFLSDWPQISQAIMFDKIAGVK